MDEKQLLQYYKETGSLDALGKLYAPYMSLLYGVCYKYLQDAEQSQDAVMQIFDELINKLRVYEVDNFKSWVYVYARNFCLMQLRKNKQITKVDIEENLYESGRCSTMMMRRNGGSKTLKNWNPVSRALTKNRSFASECFIWNRNVIKISPNRRDMI